MKLLLLLLYGILSISASAQQWSDITTEHSLGVLATQQGGDEFETETTFFANATNSLNWNQTRNNDNQGSLVFEITDDGEQSQRSASLSQVFQRQLKYWEFGASLNGVVSNSDGQGFLTLSEQFDEDLDIQQLENIDLNATDQIFRQSLTASTSANYNWDTGSNVGISLSRNDEQVSDDLTSPLAEQLIRVDGRTVNSITRLNASFDLGLELNSNDLSIVTRNEGTKILDVVQDDQSARAQLAFSQSNRWQLSLGGLRQRVRSGGFQTDVTGPESALAVQYSRLGSLELFVGVYRVDFSDGTETSKIDRTVSLDQGFDRSQSISLNYEQRFESAVDIFEVLSDNQAAFDIRGFDSETITANYNYTQRRTTSSVSLSQNNLFINDDDLTFQESIVAITQAFRQNLNETYSVSANGRRINQVSLEGSPLTNILGINLGYSAALRRGGGFYRSGTLGVTAGYETARDSNSDLETNRSTLGFNGSFLF
ncbi:MAG: hypothetical protein HRU19_22820 [Pseudobacteriovorax sp.]|nr:hypothetical protein [Pseudobacteriovorax sp.]